LKICYLANAQSIHTQRWARHFAGQGHQVRVISFEPGAIEGVEVLALPKILPWPRLNILWNLGKLRRMVWQVPPDVLHAHYVTSYGFAGALTRKHPYVVTAWGTDVLIMPEGSRMYRQMVRFALRRADLVTSMAEHMTRLLLDRGYVIAAQVVTLPFGVDTHHFNLNRRSKPHGDPPLKVVSTRRLDIGMDVDTLVRAIPLVRASIKDKPLRFIFTGDGPCRREIEDLARALKVGDVIEFRGEVFHQDMPVLLGQADVFVSTSPSDGNNISLNEAMACGAFPIATDIPANRAWIEAGKNGFLYPCRAAEQLANQIIEALRSPDLRRAVRPENWEIISTRASWARSMEEMEAQYNRLLMGKRRGRNLS
jgi:L-malate glycosyltransferase